MLPTLIRKEQPRLLRIKSVKSKKFKEMLKSMILCSKTPRNLIEKSLNQTHREEQTLNSELILWSSKWKKRNKRLKRLMNNI